MAPLPDTYPLPALREDIRIEQSASLLSGAPAWVIYDPVRHRYFQIGQQALAALSHWTVGTFGNLHRTMAQSHGWQGGREELSGLVRFLIQNRLTLAPPGGRSHSLVAERAGTDRAGLFAWVKAYLFFRIPLVKPEGFLQATLPLVQPFFSRYVVWGIVFLGLLGIFLVSRQVDHFLSYAERALSMSSLPAYALALLVIKALHELGHAYQATLRGVRVSSIGVAFMVMFPLLYTDVSDAWRAKRRRDKLMIDAGGVLVELCVAALATLAWVFLPDGGWRMAAFVLASTSWLLSLAVNLNPFMRFDGYYLLSDGMGLQNLQPRSFALARWHLREILFGLKRRPPERQSPGLRRFMIGYAYATWIYRLILFVGIAVLIYTLTFKILGVFLAAVEIGLLILLPIFRELQVWWQERGAILRSRRAWMTIFLFGGLVAFLVIPQPTKVHVPAVIAPALQADLFAFGAGQLVAIEVTEGQEVAKGQPLFRFAAPELEAELLKAQARIALIGYRLDRRGADAEDRLQTQVLQSELDAERNRLEGLETSRKLLVVRAPHDGHVVDLDPDLAPGVWVSRETRLARLLAPEGLVARGYMAEADLPRIAPGSVGHFIPDDPTSPRRVVELTTVAGFSAPVLDQAELAASQGGPIAVLTAQPQPPGGTAPDLPVPDGSWFSVTATATGNWALGQKRQPGQIVFSGRSESWAGRAVRQVAQVILREFSA